MDTNTYNCACKTHSKGTGLVVWVCVLSSFFEDGLSLRSVTCGRARCAKDLTRGLVRLPPAYAILLPAVNTRNGAQSMRSGCRKTKGKASARSTNSCALVMCGNLSLPHYFHTCFLLLFCVCFTTIFCLRQEGREGGREGRRGLFPLLFGSFWDRGRDGREVEEEKEGEVTGLEEEGGKEGGREDVERHFYS